MKPVVGACTHTDHRPAIRKLGVAGELACDARRKARVDRSYRFLPGRCVWLRVVVGLWPLPWQTFTTYSILSQREIENRCDEVASDRFRRHSPPVRTSSFGRAFVEARQVHLEQFVVATKQRQEGIGVAELQVPAARRLAIAKPDGAVWDDRLPAAGIDDNRLPFTVLTRLAKVRSPQEPVRDIGVLAFAERDQQGQVGE